MAPPGLVVPGPDTAVAVHSNIGRTRKQKHFPVRCKLAKRLACRPCHVEAVQVVHQIVAHLFAIDVVVEASVVVRTVLQLFHDGSEFARNEVAVPYVAIRVDVLHILSDFPVQLPNALPGVENCRFIHVVPETVNPKACEPLIFSAEPLPCRGV